jgi:hypothetical protein
MVNARYTDCNSDFKEDAAGCLEVSAFCGRIEHCS